MSGDATLADLRVVADYQFGAGAGEALFPADEDVTVRRSTSGRPRQVTCEAGRIVSYGTDGRFTLGVEGGRRLRASLPHPEYSVVVGDESAPFVRDGKNVFAKFVREVGESVRPRDEVVVVHDDGTVLAVGRAELAAAEMRDFSTGMAVKVRSGVDPE
ncbi:pseudouridine synthase [Halobaculum sp. CBA1158]|uniref:PUA domain-containing protein n=1 Tax=Halobaculum sp. CBA1158 TaxID=2904243 RepID=UPI001F23DE73|nr:PUA domain-containing protein [Halobaculum sp. CBA1158]UIP01184.1 pseudouridine synthase [Halobaculum sp. CBA1158]